MFFLLQLEKVRKCSRLDCYLLTLNIPSKGNTGNGDYRKHGVPLYHEIHKYQHTHTHTHRKSYFYKYIHLALFLTYTPNYTYRHTYRHTHSPQEDKPTPTGTHTHLLLISRGTQSGKAFCISLWTSVGIGTLSLSLLMLLSAVLKIRD